MMLAANSPGVQGGYHCDFIGWRWIAERIRSIHTPAHFSWPHNSSTASPNARLNPRALRSVTELELPRFDAIIFLLIIIYPITLHQMPRSLQVRLVSCFSPWFPVFKPFLLLFSLFRDFSWFLRGRVFEPFFRCIPLFSGFRAFSLCRPVSSGVWCRAVFPQSVGL